MALLLLLATLAFQAAESEGAAAYMAGRFAEARAALESEIAAGKASPRTHFWLGYTYLALGQRDRAIPQFEAYLKERPRDEDVLYALARTYAQLSDMSLQQIFRIDPASARSWVMRGIRYEVERSWKEAVQAYEGALKVDPKLRGVHASIGRIYDKELKDPAAAAREYGEELKLYPFSREANAFFASYQAKTKPAAAAKHKALIDACFAERRTTACPAPRPVGEAAEGTLALERGDAQGSLPHLLAWRAAEPENVDAYYYLGEAFTDLKVDTIQRLRAANPESYRLHQILAESHASAHQTQKAIEEYRKVLELQPQVPGVRYELGRLLSDTQTEEAVKLFEAELEMDPGHYLAASWLGRIHVVLRQPDKAIPLLERAIAAKPDLIEAQKALGQAWAAKREFARALPYYETVAVNEPDDGQIHFLLSQAYAALGRKEDAERERTLHQHVINRRTAPAPEFSPRQ